MNNSRQEVDEIVMRLACEGDLPARKIAVLALREVNPKNILSGVTKVAPVLFLEKLAEKALLRKEDPVVRILGTRKVGPDLTDMLSGTLGRLIVAISEMSKNGPRAQCLYDEHCIDWLYLGMEADPSQRAVDTPLTLTDEVLLTELNDAARLFDDPAFDRYTTRPEAAPSAEITSGDDLPF